MSVNLHLGIVVSGYRTDRMNAIKQAVQVLLEKEDLAGDLPPLTEAADLKRDGGPCLSTRSDPRFPVIISGAYDWANRVEADLRGVVESANGEACQVRFEWDDADEGREDAADEDD